MKPIASALLLILAAACDGGSSPSVSPSDSPTLAVGNAAFETRLVLTEKERRHATEELPPAREGKAYLLCWPRDRYLKLEGQNGRASFDVAFLDASGGVLETAELLVGKPEGLQSSVEARHALLAALGALKKAGLKKGDRLALPAGASQAEELRVVRVGSVQAYVELALSAAERNHGMMFRPRTSPEDGMLFSYPEEGMLSYWMANTLIPLDIAFFAADGTLINVNETPIYPDPRNPPSDYASSNSAKPARYVLEMRLGWFREKGLVDRNGQPAPGLKAVFPKESVQGRFD
jgi:uncharacterized membrane protein (UPF0127 family)